MCLLNIKASLDRALKKNKKIIELNQETKIAIFSREKLERKKNPIILIVEAECIQDVSLVSRSRI